MHRDNEFRLQQLACIGGFSWGHREEISDWQHYHFRRIEFTDDVHVAKHVGVAGMVNLEAAFKFYYVSTSFSAVDHLAIILDPAGMVGVDHCYAHTLNRLRTTFVHRKCLLCPFFLKPKTEFVDPGDLRIVLLCQFNSVSDVIAMAMCAKHHVD